TAVSLCFDITGMPILGCTPTTVTGALAVDVFTGTALAEAVLFFVAPGAVGAFAGTPPLEEVPTPDGVGLLVLNIHDLNTYLELDFTTPIPGSLVGFDGSTILTAVFSMWAPSVSRYFKSSAAASAAGARAGVVRPRSDRAGRLSSDA